MSLAPLLSRALAMRPQFLTHLETLTRIEAPSSDAAAGQRAADALAQMLTGFGFVVTREPRPGVGDIIHGSLAGQTTEPGTLILAHYDTVWPLGTLTSMPWRVDESEDRAYGPGTYDMRAGIVMALLAVQILRDEGRAPRAPLTLLITSDEETGSAQSRARIEAEALKHARVLVTEGAREDGALKVGRKGVGDIHLDFVGIPSHAGNLPDEGASALTELAHAVLFARSLDNRELATTVNPTVAKAGSATNVITEHASLSIDARVLKLSEGERVEAALRNYQPVDARVKVRMRGGLNRPPMEPTVGNMALYAQARGLLQAWGLDAEAAVVGGGSDGNFTSALGIPTLDGLGACGAGAHARHEHVRITQTLERTALLAALIGDLRA